MPNGDKLPFILPDGYWKVEATAYYKGNVIAINVYFKSITSAFGIF